MNALSPALFQYELERAAADMKPITYRPPVDKVCPCCGKKHFGQFSMCRSDQDAFNSGR